MADIKTDKRTKVWWVPTISAIATPTVAELTAGTSLECTIRAGGLKNLAPKTNAIDNAALCSEFATSIGGRAVYSDVSLMLKKAAATGDTIYDLLVRDLDGYLAVRRDLLISVAWVAAQKVEIYPARCGEVANEEPEADGIHLYTVPLFITSDPNLRAVVAA